MTKNQKTSKESILEFVRRNRFIGPDPELKRYTRLEFKDYIKTCCKNSHYLEAYNLAFQYINDLVISLIDNNSDIKDTQVSTIVTAFNSIGLIDENTYENYKRVYKLRNKLTHDILRKPTILESMKKAPHLTDLDRLIEDFEEFYLKFYEKNPKKFAFNNDLNTNRNKKLVHIVSDRIIPKITSELTKSDLPYDQYMQQFDDIFKREFENFLVARILNSSKSKST